MYGVIGRILEQRGWSQAKLASEVGSNAPQVSRWIGQHEKGSLFVFCRDMRNLAMKYPEEWLTMLAAPDFLDALPEFDNLLYFDDQFPFPKTPLWVISEAPAEFEREDVRKATADMIHQVSEASGAKQPADAQCVDDPYIVYWIPRSAQQSMTRLFLRLKNKYRVPQETLAKHIRVVVSPDHLFLFQMGILNPDSDDRIGFVSMYRSQHGKVRVQIIPTPTVLHIYNMLSPILEDLIYNSGIKEVEFDGSKWALFDPLEDAL